MRLRKILVLIFVAICLVESASGSAPRTFRIMTFNLRAGTMATMDQIAEAINDCNPDFVALQEVDCNTYRPNAKATGNNGVNFINELAQRTGMFGYFGTTINLPPSAAVRDSLSTLVATGKNINSLPAMEHYYGIALLSCYPAVKTECYPLPNPLGAEPRILLLGTFLPDGKTPVGFATVHLDYTNDSTIALQVETVAEVMAKNGPAIVAGDFNTVNDSEAYRIICRRAIPLSGSAPTFPSDSPNRRLDHIIGCPAESFSLVETTERTRNSRILSDHIPVVSTVRFMPDAGR